jgi:hypothetical protein
VGTKFHKDRFKSYILLVGHRLNAGNACYHYVQNLLSSRLLSNNVKIRIYEIIILSLFLCGFSMRRIFVPKKDEVTGEWREWHNKELHDLHSSRSIIRMLK